MGNVSDELMERGWWGNGRRGKVLGILYFPRKINRFTYVKYLIDFLKIRWWIVIE